MMDPKKQKKLVWGGWAMIALGIAAFFLFPKLGNGQTGFFSVDNLGMGIFVGCLMQGIEWIRAGDSEEGYKKYQAENDERMKAIELRTARITLYATWGVLLAAAVLESVRGNYGVVKMANALFLIGITIFCITGWILERKM